MAKLFSPNNSLNSNQTNIPTAEQNQALYLSIQERNQQLKNIKTADSLSQIQKEQYGDLDSATDTNPEATAFNERYAGMANPDLNQDMSQQPQAKDLDELNKNSLSKLTDSMPPIVTNLIFIFLGILVIRFLFGKRR